MAAVQVNKSVLVLMSCLFVTVLTFLCLILLITNVNFPTIPDARTLISYSKKYNEYYESGEFNSIFEWMATAGPLILLYNYIGLLGAIILNVVLTVWLIFCANNKGAFLFISVTIFSPFWLNNSLGPSKEILLFCATFLVMSTYFQMRFKMSCSILAIAAFVRPGFIIILSSILLFFKFFDIRKAYILLLLCVAPSWLFNVLGYIDFPIFSHFINILDRNIITSSGQFNVLETFIYNSFYNVLFRFDEGLPFHYWSMGVLISFCIFFAMFGAIKNDPANTLLLIIACGISLTGLPHSRYFFPLTGFTYAIINCYQFIGPKSRMRN